MFSIDRMCSLSINWGMGIHSAAGSTLVSSFPMYIILYIYKILCMIHIAIRALGYGHTFAAFRV